MLLAITILLIPLILLEMIFVLASAFLGTAALALLDRPAALRTGQSGDDALAFAGAWWSASR